MKEEGGFTLIELLIVVAIIGIITAIAVPSLKKARQAAFASSAVASLRTINTAEALYYRKGTGYGLLANLAPDGTLDTVLASGSKGDYNFVITLSNLDVNGNPQRFQVTADPQETVIVLTHYFIDDTGVIRANVGAPATATSAPL
ncbi:MAG TPA: prepilin-type N-terminal cleavage/methylation domain-containing protein [Blastocatellia bacterium]|nr:prepilin-type N-terminal cleavage/methylation domain-containing protein [Blastocatellia bacterium]